MQDIDALKGKSIAELREIGKAFGIDGRYKKNELIEKIVAAATPADTPDTDAPGQSDEGRKRRGRRPRTPEAGRQRCRSRSPCM